MRPMSLMILASVFLSPAATAGVCDDLKTRVCADLKMDPACLAFVHEQLRSPDGKPLNEVQAVMACKLTLDDATALKGLRHKAHRGMTVTPFVGLWAIDLERTMEADPKMRAMPADAKAQAMAQAKDFLGTMSFEFTISGRAIATMSGRREESAFVVKSHMGQTYDIEMREGEKVEAMTFTLQGDRLRMQQGTQVLVLKRAKR